MTIKSKHHIWHNGERFSPGDIINTLDLDTEKQLVQADAAFFVQETSTSIDFIGENVYKETNAREEKSQEWQDIDDNFTLEELKVEAERLEMKFPSSIKKKDLIAQIFAEVKQNEFLELLEDEE